MTCRASAPRRPGVLGPLGLRFRPTPVDGARCALIAALFAVPVAFSAATLEAGAVKTVVAHAAVVVATLCLWWHSPEIAGRWRQARGLWVAGGAFLSVLLLSAVFGRHPAPAWAEVWRWTMGLGVGALTVVACHRTVWLRVIAWVVVLARLAVLGYAVVQKLGHDPVRWSDAFAGRVFSFVGNPNMLAGYCLLIGFLAAGLAAASRWWLRLPLLAAAGLILLVFAWTESRGAMLGLAAGGACLTCCALRARGWSWARVAAVAAPLLLLATAGACWFLRDSFAARGGIWHLDVHAYGSQNQRLLFWLGAWRIFAEDPLLGAGPGHFPLMFPGVRNPDYERTGLLAHTHALHAHGEWAEILADIGILGLLAFVALIAAVLGRWKRSYAAMPALDRRLGIGLVCGVVALLAHNLVSVNLRWPVCFFHVWVFLGLLAAQGLRWAPPRQAAVAPGSRGWMWPLRVLGLAGAVALTGLFVLGSWRPFLGELATMRGKRLSDRGHWLAAETAFAEAVALSPVNLRARYLRAASLFFLREYERAAATYQALRTHAPDYIQVHYNLAACYLHLREWDRAAVHYRRQATIGGLPKSFDLDRLIAVLRAQGLTEDQRYSRSLETLIAENPDDHLAHLAYGNFLFRHGAYLAAKDHYERVLERVPQHVAALNNLAGISFRTGDYDRALVLCRRGIGYRSDEPVPWINLGKLHVVREELDRARACFRRAVSLAPDNAEARTWLDRLAARD